MSHSKSNQKTTRLIIEKLGGHHIFSFFDTAIAQAPRDQKALQIMVLTLGGRCLK
jgi:hypothetical protein